MLREDQAEVTSNILTADGKKIPLDYRMIRKEAGWRVYDVIIEGISLVKNYRDQFRDILAKDSPERGSQDAPGQSSQGLTGTALFCKTSEGKKPPRGAGGFFFRRGQAKRPSGDRLLFWRPIPRRGPDRDARSRSPGESLGTDQEVIAVLGLDRHADAPIRHANGVQARRHPEGHMLAGSEAGNDHIVVSHLHRKPPAKEVVVADDEQLPSAGRVRGGGELGGAAVRTGDCQHNCQENCVSFHRWFPFSIKRAWPPRCIKMTRRSPEHAVEAAADCLSRLRGLGPDPMAKSQLSRNSPMVSFGHFFEDGRWVGIVPVGGEFQTRTQPHEPGGGHSTYLGFIERGLSLNQPGG